MKTTKEIINNISEDQNEMLAMYFDLIEEYNKHTNITRITSKEDFLNKHIIDSLLPFDDELKEGYKLLDVGTGGGFPGLVLAIVFPNIEVTLLDSNNKKTKFLKIVVDALKLTNVKIILKRAEEIITEEREYFDVVTARAVSATNILIELLAPFVKVNGKVILLKGPKAFEEIKELKNGYEKVGLKKDSIKEFDIEDNKRVILLW